jgi:hypothetical protein
MLTPPAFRERLAWIEDAAGERFGKIEIGALMMDVVVTDDAETAERAFLDRVQPAGGAARPTREELLASPLVAIGSIEAVCEKLEKGRDEFGISYLTCPAHARMDVLAPVIERLAGR